jgi:hypothetical protein
MIITLDTCSPNACTFYLRWGNSLWYLLAMLYRLTTWILLKQLKPEPTNTSDFAFTLENVRLYISLERQSKQPHKHECSSGTEVRHCHGTSTPVWNQLDNTHNTEVREVAAPVRGETLPSYACNILVYAIKGFFSRRHICINPFSGILNAKRHLNLLLWHDEYRRHCHLKG